jgi:hypothetical protein
MPFEPFQEDDFMAVSTQLLTQWAHLSRLAPALWLVILLAGTLLHSTT